MLPGLVLGRPARRVSCLHGLFLVVAACRRNYGCRTRCLHQNRSPANILRRTPFFTCDVTCADKYGRNAHDPSMNSLSSAPSSAGQFCICKVAGGVPLLMESVHPRLKRQAHQQVILSELCDMRHHADSSNMGALCWRAKGFRGQGFQGPKHLTSGSSAAASAVHLLRAKNVYQTLRKQWPRPDRTVK